MNNLDLALNETRITYAFELIGRAHTVTICSLKEMRAICVRALLGEFDKDLENVIRQPADREEQGT